jgi:hypothetical protein
LLLPETDGVWIHVVAKDGQGITRIGGPSAAPLDSLSPAGAFRAVSALARLADGRVLVSDATWDRLTVFTPDLKPERTVRVPGAHRIYGISALPDGRLAAAVAPRNPATGSQVLLFAPGDSGPGFFPPDPLFEHNRWQGVSATSIAATANGAVLAYWPALPWALALSAKGDSLGRLGSMSDLYKGPSSGPSPHAGSEGVQRWLESFTPLLAVQPVGEWLVFEYRAAKPPTPRDRAKAAPSPRQTDRPAHPVDPGQMFLNVLDGRGRPVARDLVLPAGTRILRSDDTRWLYLLTRADPRELRIEIWEPRTGT